MKPRWSPDGKRIAFLSARGGTGRSRLFAGIGAEKGIYMFDLDSRNVQEIGASVSRALGGRISSLDWSSRNTIVVAGRKQLLEFDVGGDSLWSVGEFAPPPETILGDLRVSPDGMRIAIEYYGEDRFPRFAVFSRSGGPGKAAIIPDPSRWTEILGWSEDSRFLYCRSEEPLRRYDAETGEYSVVSLPKHVLERQVLLVRPLPDGDIVFHVKGEGKGLGIALYRSFADTIETLIKDKRKREEIELKP